MNDVFLKERQKALEKFLWRLVAHPFFSFDQDIKIFLTASDEVEQQGSRKEGSGKGRKRKWGNREEGGWLGGGREEEGRREGEEWLGGDGEIGQLAGFALCRNANTLLYLTVHCMIEFVLNLLLLVWYVQDFAVRLSETVMLKGTKLLDMVSSSVKQAATSLRLRNVDAEFVKEAKYFSDLSEKLGVVEKVGNRMYDERKEVLTSQEDFSTVVFQWSMLEPKITQPLQKLANCVDNCSTALKSLVGIPLLPLSLALLLSSLPSYLLFFCSSSSSLSHPPLLSPFLPSSPSSPSSQHLIFLPTSFS